ncbi:MAG: ankyrin repeat domain-containing protein [Chthoniobacterales bacterium]
MFPPRTPLLAAAFLAGAWFLHPTRLAPVREARTQLPPEAISRAVATSDPALLDFALAQGVSVDAVDAEGRTALSVAVTQRDRPMIQRLLAFNANVDLADKTGRTPLMTAAMQGDLETLEALLARSQHPEATDAEGRSAAHHAIAAGQYGSFDLLLPRLPELDEPAADGRDLLAFAFDTGNARMMKAVLSRLPDDLEWTTRTRSALRFALESDDADLARILLCKNRGAPTVEGTTVPLLADAILGADTETFRSLLAAGADANTALPKPSEPAFVKRLPTELLRSYVKGDEGVTVLMLAAGLGKSEYVRALLEAGASRNVQTKRYKMLALYFAARARETKSLQILLGRGPTRDELRVEISLATQKASVIKDGVAILQTSVSTGRKGFDTPPGEYVVTDKNRSHVSSLYRVEMPFFMRLNCLDFGLHAGNVPNYPASHGCIRLPADVAQKLFSEIPVGTVVTIN